MSHIFTDEKNNRIGYNDNDLNTIIFENKNEAIARLKEYNDMIDKIKYCTRYDRFSTEKECLNCYKSDNYGNCCKGIII